MNLSIFELAYLGSRAKDTAQMGKNKMLRYANSQIVTDATDKRWMQLLGIASQPDWPLARLLWLAESTNLAADGHSDGSMLLAQPVHFSLQRDSFALDALITLSSEECHELTDCLNRHFAEEGIAFIPSETHQYWFLQTSDAWQLTTTPMQCVLGQNVQAWMPQGPDAINLRQVSNQVQMLLHEHPLNQKRLLQGLPEMNSLWFSGNSLAEQLKPSLRTEHTVLIGENALTRAISASYHIPHFADLETALVSGVKTAVMLVDRPESVSWDAIYRAVQSRKIHALNAHFPLGSSTLQVSLKPLDCWKFWRRPHALSTYIEQYVQNH